MKVISVINCKGGVGKTTFTVSISQALAISGFKVLAIDNDSQHNLTYLLGEKIFHPNIRDIYRSSIKTARRNFLYSIRETGLSNLHIITSQSTLKYTDVRDPFILVKIIKFYDLDRFYDFILIDNPPGLDLLQEASIHASNEIFVPTDLSYFAINGIREMSSRMNEKFRSAYKISRIIPNGYRNLKPHKYYLTALNNNFPDIVSKTYIPYDPVFDLCMRDGKILFIHRLYSKAATNYLKLAHELFNLNEDVTWEKVMEKRQKSLRKEARIRYFIQKEGTKNTKPVLQKEGKVIKYVAKEELKSQTK
ncbi:MAG: ParA family protein [Chitinispirillia bacterium]|jgi:chromosome partitioning protein